MRIGIAGPFSTISVKGRIGSLADRMPAGLGGTPVCSLVEGLLEAGHEVSVYTLDPTVSDPEVFHSGRLHVFYGPYCPSARTRALTRFGGERAAIASFVVEDAPEVVHAHWTYEFALGALDARPDALVTVHDTASAILRRTPDLYRLSRWTLDRSAVRRARHLTAVSPHTADAVRRRTAVPCPVIPNIVAPEALSVGRGSTSGEGRLVAVSENFGHLKNSRLLLQAFPLVRDVLPGCTLVMIGREFGPGGKAEAWAQQRRLDRSVVFAGAMSHVDTIRAIGAADLLVHPSLEESFGMVVAEAMAAGTPVVAGSGSGAVPWVMDGGIAGRLVDVTDVRAVSAAIVELLGDSSLWARASDAGRESARERFSSPVVTARYLEEYAQVAR